MYTKVEPMFTQIYVAIWRHWSIWCGTTLSSTQSMRTTWWRHEMETFFALLALCEGNPPVTGGFPSQRPVTRSFDVVFDVRLDKRLNKQWKCWWFETPWCSCDVTVMETTTITIWWQQQNKVHSYLSTLEILRDTFHTQRPCATAINIIAETKINC